MPRGAHEKAHSDIRHGVQGAPAFDGAVVAGDRYGVGLAQIEGRHVERSGELLDAPPKRPVRHLKFSVLLTAARIETEERAVCEQQLIEADLRVNDRENF